MIKFNSEQDFDKAIDILADRMVNEFLQGKTIIDIIKPDLKKCFHKNLFSNIRILAILESVNTIEVSLKSNTNNSKELYNISSLKKSLLICENCINTIWEELYKIIFAK